MLAYPNGVHDWCRVFDHIYGPGNAGKPWLYYAAMLPTHLGLLASPKYFAGSGDSCWQFSKTIAWLMAIHNSQAKPFTEKPAFGVHSHLGTLLLAEFPKACPYCGLPECNYDPEQHSSRVRRSQRNSNFNKYTRLLSQEPNVRNFTLHQWAESIANIYPKDKDAPMPMLAGKLFEEFGELVGALQVYRERPTIENRADYCEEYADLFSRLCVFGFRALDAQPEARGQNSTPMTLDEIVWQRYEKGCPTCHKRFTEGSVCVCHEEPWMDTQQGIFADMYGPGGAPQDGPVTVAPVFNITSSSSAAANADAEASATIRVDHNALLDLHGLAVEDRETSPMLEELVRRIDTHLTTKQTDVAQLRAVIEELLQNAPPPRRNRYFEVVKRLVSSAATSLGATALAGKLQSLLEELAQFLSGLS